jgi:uncharacterized repeat protein (TIGR01451 family)
VLLAALVFGGATRAETAVEPSVAITSPSSGTQIAGNGVDVTVAFNATANDPQEPTGNVTLVELTLDGGTVGGFMNPPGTKSGSHTFGVDLSAVAAGEHTLVARAYQGNPGAGHVGTSGAVTITVVRTPPPDRTPPTISASVEPAANAAGWHAVAPLVSFDASDAESGIAFVTAPVRVETEGAGQVVTGTARDGAGNEATASVTVNVDTTAPALTVLAPASGSTVATSAVLLQGTAQDATSGLDAVTCNGAAATVSGTSFSCALTVAVGPNTVAVRATDRAGNTTESSVGLTLAPPAGPAPSGPAAPTGADVSVTTSVSPSSAGPGERVTYTIVARNAGPERATAVVVTTALGSGFDFVSVSSSAGSCSRTSPVRCELGALAAGTSATIMLVATVRAAGDTSGAVGVSATEADPNLGNNVGSAVVVVVATAAPPTAEAPPTPVQGVSAVARPVSGTVLVNGQRLAALGRIPIGARVDVRNGKIELTTTSGKAVFSAGRFNLKQARSRGAATELTLVADVAAACRSTAARRSLSANKKPSEKKVVARLWGQGKGSFRTTARFSSATVRGTVWLTVERCDGSLTSVRQGVVAVYDKVKKKTVLVRAGRSYLAKPKGR